MANPNQRLGKARIKVNGVELETMPGATLDLGGVTRTTVVGANAVLGPTETPKPARVECSVSLRAGQSAADLNTDNATITFIGDTGQVWSIPNAWSMETPVVNSGDGTVRCVYEGVRCEEVG